MITPEEARRLARQRRAMGGETWLPVPTAAQYAEIPAKALYVWIGNKRVRRVNGNVDLGELLEVRDRSTMRVPEVPLTYRVLAYYRLVANGWTSQEIATKYGIGVWSVHNSLNHAARALGARNRTHAVALLVARGVISSADLHVSAPPTVDKLAGERSSSAMRA